MRRLAAAALAALAAPAIAAPPAAADGQATYTKWCAPCHAPGLSHPGTNALTAKYKGEKPGVLLEWRDLAPDYVRYMVRNGISVMPRFRKTEISDRELDALAAWMVRQKK